LFWLQQMNTFPRRRFFAIVVTKSGVSAARRSASARPDLGEPGGGVPRGSQTQKLGDPFVDRGDDQDGFVADGEFVVLSGRTDRVRAVAFRPDGHTLVIGSADQIARRWETDPERVASRVCAVAQPRITPR